MKRKLAITAGLLPVVAAATLAVPATAQAEDHRTDRAVSRATDRAAGFRVSDGRLLDANGEDFVLRGVNHAHTWYPDRTDQALSDIKALGANAVRVVLSTGDRWTKNDTADVKGVVAECKKNRLICVLEAHDTTGYGEQAGAAPLSAAVDYWIDIQDAVKGEEEYLILNIGNEPHGNSGHAAWTDDTSQAIGRMRAAGFTHTFMADAPNWGQDWTHIMRDNAPDVFAADPDKNTIFSIHMYGVFAEASTVRDYLNRFVNRGLPIAVGEFGHDHSDGNPDEDAILATTEELGLGYLGWSWSGNGGGVEYLDMATDFDAGRLTSWGERLFNGPDGIQRTAREASVFGDGTGDPAGSCAVTYRLSDWGDRFNADVTVRNTGTEEIKGWQLDFAFPGSQTLHHSWNAKVVQDGRRLRATDEPWTETIPAGGAVSFGLNGASTGPNGVPAEFALNGTACTRN
ncbi:MULTISPECIES: cellulase family glycosylhydrolase [unclassified Streptomyces]|uniref:cellulase family glycosylhydrolase n=1 Tax=unclassified Streptomyces TaxID=2593676 RepID=UPI003328824F